MVSLRVRAEFGGRFDARVAAVPGGWLTASAQALTRWTQDGPGAPLVATDPLPGPLRWLPGTGHIGWGPTVLDGSEPRWPADQLGRELLSDLGDLGSRRFSLVLGAVSDDESEVFVAYQQPRSRARGGADPRELVRQAVVHPDGTLVEVVPGALPTAALWGDGELALGGPGVVRVRQRAEVWRDHVLGDTTAARSLARGPVGSLSAGTARGDVVVVDDEGVADRRWSAHDGPVTALSASTDLLASGGIDGVVRVWEGDRCRAEADLGRPVVDVAWAGPDQLVALVGDAGATLVVLEL